MGPIFTIIILVLGVLAIVALWRFVSGGSGREATGSGDRSLEVLRERFARGEIDEEEFEARKRALNR
ncbi:SHOCT domain-containing protein [Dichotomicrobium thermohalophilum]|uniref:Putative membrane protein n=1 Tax=Dichotomicrobium thermohalophilum TaxID=933063 RepID=A0A397Q5C0_9HYPH|nr:SHOCT domain-containing protein [Dichotomicrobium thermohalophilum]RIA56302.1 putative membrane protein [Dichotomicrobium thermohalophilum]